MVSGLLISSALALVQFIVLAQAEVSVVFTDIDAMFNSKYFASDYEVFLLDEGIDNQIFVNFTVIQYLPESSMVYFKIVGATMGEYKINTGLNFDRPLCELPDEPIVFGRLLRKMGMELCPGKLGNYGNEAFEVDLSTLPDEFTPNKYALDAWAETDDEDKICHFRLYFTVQ